MTIDDCTKLAATTIGLFSAGFTCYAAYLAVKAAQIRRDTELLINSKTASVRSLSKKAFV